MDNQNMGQSVPNQTPQQEPVVEQAPQQPQAPQVPQQPSNAKGLLWTLVGVLVVAIVGVGGYYMWQGNGGKNKEPITKSVNELIVKAFEDKYSKLANITIEKQDDAHVRGSVKFSGEETGGWFLATKVDGKWIIVDDGNGTINCFYKTEYGFPDNMMEDCYDPTADWKTYKNDTYGFEFKYPNKLSNTVQRTSNQIQTYLFSVTSGEYKITKSLDDPSYPSPPYYFSQDYLNVSILSKTSLIDAEKYLFPDGTSNISGGFIKNNKYIKIDNHDAQKIDIFYAGDAGDKPPLNQIVFVQVGNKILILNCGITVELECSQILSTFKFIDVASSTADISTPSNVTTVPPSSTVKNCGSVDSYHLSVNTSALTQTEKTNLDCINTTLKQCSVSEITLTNSLTPGVSYKYVIQKKEGDNCIIKETISNSANVKICKLPINNYILPTFRVAGDSNSQFIFAVVPMAFTFGSAQNTETGEMINFSCN